MVFVQERIGHTLDIIFPFGNEEAAAFGCLLQQLKTVLLPRADNAVALFDRVGVELAQPQHEIRGQGLAVEHVAFDRVGDGQHLADLLTVEFRPEDARRVEQIQRAVDADPLAAARHARLVARRRGLPPRDLVDKRGLADVRDAQHHDPETAAALSLAFIFGKLVPEQLAHGGGKGVHAAAGARVRFEHGETLLAEIRGPFFRHSRIGQVAAVEDHEPGLAGGKPVDVRVAARARDAGVQDLAHRVDESDVLLDHALGLGHVPGEPLDIQLFKAVLSHYSTLPKLSKG